jgi:hypothetical protein
MMVLYLPLKRAIGDENAPDAAGRSA